MQCRLFYCIMENEQRGMSTFILAVCGNVDYIYTFPPSPPSRAAWIEMRSAASGITAQTSRRLHGRRGLKYVPNEGQRSTISRRLHGRRGLKCPQGLSSNAAWLSPPSRAAWIEIRMSHTRLQPTVSPPSRAAWIEICDMLRSQINRTVAAFTGGVD